jgi:hypothetical protein
MTHDRSANTTVRSPPVFLPAGRTARRALQRRVYPSPTAALVAGLKSCAADYHRSPFGDVTASGEGRPSCPQGGPRAARYSEGWAPPGHRRGLPVAQPALDAHSSPEIGP